MCGRFTLAPASGQLFGPRFGLAEDVAVDPRWNIAPGTQIAVITRREESNRFDRMHWGLVPSWAKSPADGYKMINARAETLTERPAYRGLVERRRCLVPADGFYEWQARETGGKQPWLFREPGDEVFSLAGLWTTWTPGEGVEPLESVTIITTEPNAVVKPVHRRMPAILLQDQEDDWLDPAFPVDGALAMLGPLPVDRLVGWPVSTRVNRVANDDPECVKPVEPADEAPGGAGQAGLF